MWDKWDKWDKWDNSVSQNENGCSLEQERQSHPKMSINDFIVRVSVVARNDYTPPRYDGRPSTLQNYTKKQFADLMLRYADQAEKLTPDQTLKVELPDGRLLTFNTNTLGGEPPLREWSVHLYTLNQRTERCLRKLHVREAWLYLAPYEGEGYKVDPSGKWSYSVWR
jgi:hypothetical protein